MKHLYFKTFLFAVLLLHAATANAYDCYVYGIYYRLNSSDKTASVTYRDKNYNSYSGSVNIPESITYNGTTYSVTSIDYMAFRGCSGLTSVVIPNSVTSIDDYAFYNCTGLTSITIPNSVTSIGDSAFSGCTGLTSITIPNSVTSIGSSAISGCSRLTEPVYNSTFFAYMPRTYQGEYTIPDGIVSICDHAFRGCTGLTSITIPNSVTLIGDYAFSDCTGLTSITIPNSVTSIGASAFGYCTGLTSITIPNSVTSIGSRVFWGCAGLTSITIPNSVTSIEREAFLGCTGLTSITIPNSVTSIGASAFSGCTGLTSITIPNSVTSIGDKAFQNCIKLTRVTLNNNSIVSKTYTSSSNIKTIFGEQVTDYIIGNDVISIGIYAFYGCSGLNSITIPNSVTSIGGAAFYGCSGLNSITIPNSVISIGDGAFMYCTGLTSITIPNSVMSIGSSAFYNCSGLTSITIPNNVTSIGHEAFHGCTGLTEPLYNSTCFAYMPPTYQGEYIIPDGILSICDGAFEDCTGLISITIPNSITSIGSQAFWGCSGLTSVTIPNSVTSIEREAFLGCTGLTSITIPNSVTSIERGAFWGCSGLKSVTIPNSITSISESMFYRCSGLTSITIPNSVTSIGSQAFVGCSRLTSIYIPESVTSIGIAAFYYYDNNHNIDIASNIKKVTLNSNAIASKTYTSSSNIQTIFGKQVTEYVIGDDVTSIGSCAFYGCSGLNSITIPKSVTSIGQYAFYDCTASVYVHDATRSLLTLWNYGITPKEIGTERELKRPYLSYTSTPTTATLKLNDKYIAYTYTINDNESISDTCTITGLNPEQTVYVELYGSLGDFTKKINGLEIRTSAVSLIPQQHKVVSPGNAIVSAQTNIENDDETVGFEWRRTDWTDEFESKQGTAYLFEGNMEGYIRNLNTNYLWKFRPYYKSAAGNYYYGEWKGLDPTDTSFFEPTVHTYNNISIDGNSASVKGYAMRGSDNTVQQGFMYWEDTAHAKEMYAASSVPSSANIIEASGTIMEATLTNLHYETTYHYVAFVKTSEGETYYGEEKVFTTGADTTPVRGITTNTDAVEVIGYYDLQGHKLNAPQRGINIIRMSDGTTRKVVVK